MLSIFLNCFEVKWELQFKYKYYFCQPETGKVKKKETPPLQLHYNKQLSWSPELCCERAAAVSTVINLNDASRTSMLRFHLTLMLGKFNMLINNCFLAYLKNIYILYYFLAEYIWSVCLVSRYSTELCMKEFCIVHKCIYKNDILWCIFHYWYHNNSGLTQL